MKTAPAAIAFVPILLSSAAAFAPALSRGVFSTTARTTSRLYEGGMWDEPPKAGPGVEMSKALPFAPRPKILDGSLPGDVGFE